MIKRIVLTIAFITTGILSLLASTDTETLQLYNQIGLKDIMPYELFMRGVNGYNKIEKKKDIITFIDFSKASSDERIYVIDIKNKKLLYKTYVSHGKNIGSNYATSFSNTEGSFKSSLGFFITTGTYNGKNGYSLKLNGLEENINDNAAKRYIVMHGAKYSNPSTIKQNGRLGRSLGCPALPQFVSNQIIDTIKDGSVLFIYAENNEYLTKSQYMS